MQTVNEACSECKDAIIEDFNDNHKEDLAQETLESWIGNQSEEVSDVVDSVFENFDSDEVINEGVDNYCDNVGGGDEEDIVYDYGIDNAIDSYGGCGEKCGEMIVDIIKESIDREDIVSDMKESVEQRADELVEEYKVEHSGEAFKEAYEKFKTAKEEFCAFFPACHRPFACPAYVDNEMKASNGNTTHCMLRLMEIKSEMIIDEIDKKSSNESSQN